MTSALVSPAPVLSGGYNVGDSNTNGLLEAGETWVFTAGGLATAGQYSNLGTVTGADSFVPGNTVSASNPDNYFGDAPAIQIVKLTNGTDNDSPTGPHIKVGDPVTWTYNVTATGSNGDVELVPELGAYTSSDPKILRIDKATGKFGTGKAGFCFHP